VVHSMNNPEATIIPRLKKATGGILIRSTSVKFAEHICNLEQATCSLEYDFEIRRSMLGPAQLLLVRPELLKSRH